MAASTPLERLAQLGLELPPVPAPAAAYRPWALVGDLVFTAGQVPMVDGELPRTGLLGRDITVEEGQELSRIAALNVLAVLAEACGGLDDVDVVKVTVFVASTPDFHQHHVVADGASTLLADVLGERGRHARSAVGVAALPLDSPVEVEAVVSRRAATADG